jgi:urease accessory protein
VALRAGLIVSAAPLGDDGAIVRLAGVSVEEIGAVLRSLLGGLRTHLGAAPWDRKW